MPHERDVDYLSRLFPTEGSDEFAEETGMEETPPQVRRILPGYGGTRRPAFEGGRVTSELAPADLSKMREFMSEDTPWYLRAARRAGPSLLKAVTFPFRWWAENVSQPAAAFTVMGMQAFLGQTDSDLWRSYSGARAGGKSGWDAAQEAFEDWEISPWLKMGMELAVDPTSYLGWGIFAKLGRLTTFAPRFGGVAGTILGRADWAVARAAYYPWEKGAQFYKRVNRKVAEKLPSVPFETRDIARYVAFKSVNEIVAPLGEALGKPLPEAVAGELTDLGLAATGKAVAQGYHTAVASVTETLTDNPSVSAVLARAVNSPLIPEALPLRRSKAGEVIGKIVTKVETSRLVKEVAGGLPEKEGEALVNILGRKVYRSLNPIQKELVTAHDIIQEATLRAMSSNDPAILEDAANAIKRVLIATDDKLPIITKHLEQVKESAWLIIQDMANGSGPEAITKFSTISIATEDALRRLNIGAYRAAQSGFMGVMSRKVMPWVDRHIYGGKIRNSLAQYAILPLARAQLQTLNYNPLNLMEYVTQVLSSGAMPHLASDETFMKALAGGMKVHPSLVGGEVTIGGAQRAGKIPLVFIPKGPKIGLGRFGEWLERHLTPGQLRSLITIGIDMRENAWRPLLPWSMFGPDEGNRLMLEFHRGHFIDSYVTKSYELAEPLLRSSGLTADDIAKLLPEGIKTLPEDIAQSYGRDVMLALNAGIVAVAATAGTDIGKATAARVIQLTGRQLRSASHNQSEIANAVSKYENLPESQAIVRQFMETEDILVRRLFREVPLLTRPVAEKATTLSEALKDIRARVVKISPEEELEATIRERLITQLGEAEPAEMPLLLHALEGRPLSDDLLEAVIRKGRPLTTPGGDVVYIFPGGEEYIIQEKALLSLKRPSVATVVPPVARELTTKVWATMSVPERVALVKESGLPGTLASKAAADLEDAEWEALKRTAGVMPPIAAKPPVAGAPPRAAEAVAPLAIDFPPNTVVRLHIGERIIEAKVLGREGEAFRLISGKRGKKSLLLPVEGKWNFEERVAGKAVTSPVDRLTKFEGRTTDEQARLVSQEAKLTRQLEKKAIEKAYTEADNIVNTAEHLVELVSKGLGPETTQDVHSLLTNMIVLNQYSYNSRHKILGIAGREAAKNPALKSSLMKQADVDVVRVQTKMSTALTDLSVKIGESFPNERALINWLDNFREYIADTTKLGEDIVAKRASFFAENPGIWNQATHGAYDAMIQEAWENGLERVAAGAPSLLDLPSGRMLIPNLGGKVFGETAPTTVKDLQDLLGVSFKDMPEILRSSPVFMSRTSFIRFFMRTASVRNASFKSPEELGRLYDSFLEEIGPRTLNWNAVEAEAKALAHEVINIKANPMISTELRGKVGEVAETVLRKAASLPDDAKKQFAKIRDEAYKFAYAKQDTYFYNFGEDEFFDWAMKFWMPFWMYESRVIPWLAKMGVSHPILLNSFGHYRDNTDRGYVPIGGNVQINPLLGTGFNRMAKLDSRKYPEYLSGGVFELQDWLERAGFFASPLFTVPVSLIEGARQRSPRLETGTFLPPAYTAVLNLGLREGFGLVSSPEGKKAMADMSQFLTHDRYKDYSRDLILAEKVGMRRNQLERLLADPTTKQPEKDRLLKALNESNTEATLIEEVSNLLGWARIRPKEYTEFRERYKNAYAALTGVSSEDQELLWSMGYRPQDMVALSPMTVRVLTQLKGSAFGGATRKLMPLRWQKVMEEQEQFFGQIEKIRNRRYAEQLALDTALLSGEMAPEVWKVRSQDVRTRYIDGREELQNFAEAQGVPIQWSSKEESKFTILKWREQEGMTIPPVHPLRRLLDDWFQEDVTEIHGVLDFDAQRRKRQAIEAGVPPHFQDEFYSEVMMNMTPLEKLRWAVGKGAMLPYWEADDKVVASLPEYAKAIVERATFGDYAERTAARDTVVFKEYRGRLARARIQLRKTDPWMDYYLMLFGYVTRPLAGKGLWETYGVHAPGLPRELPETLPESRRAALERFTPPGVELQG